MLEHGDGNVVDIHPGRSAMDDTRGGMGHIGGHAGCIDEIGEVAWSGKGFGFPDVIVDQVDEFTEDGEFKFQLDAVYDAFEHGFHDVEVQILGDEQAHVQNDDDEVDDQ